MKEIFHRNASVSSNNTDNSNENFESFHSYKCQKPGKVLYRKLIKVSGTVMFNLLCLKNYLLPKYTIMKNIFNKPIELKK